MPSPSAARAARAAGLLLAALATSPTTATPAATAPLCPPGHEVRPGTGLDGGYGCHPLAELERPDELLAARAASLGPRAGLHADDRLAALAQARRLWRDAEARRLAAGSRDFVTASGAVVAASGNAWRARGPRPLHADDPAYAPSSLGWTTLTGRVTALAVDPRDLTGDTVYLGSAAGGVWKTTDGGATWVPIGDSLPTLAIGAVAVHPTSGWVYVGTGEGNTNSDAYAGAGAFRSKDGGATWEPLGRPGARVPNDVVIPHVEVAGDYVYVATSGGLYRSADRGDRIAKVDLPTGNDTPLGTFVSDVRVRPGIAGHTEVTAAVGWRSGDTGGAGLYRSTDAGETWAKLDSPTFGAVSPSADKIGRTTIAYPTGPEQDNKIMWAVIQDPGKLNTENNPIAMTTPAMVPPTTLNGVYRSGDDGLTWELKGSYEIFQNPATNPGSALLGALTPTYGPGIQAWYNQFVAVDPTDVDRVVVGLEEIYYTVANANLAGPAEWRTAGRYWNSCSGLTTSLGNCPEAPPVYGGTTTHPDQHAIAFARLEGGGSRAYVGNDGGVYSQEPDDVTGFTPSEWTPLNDTLDLIQPYAAVMGGDGTIWAGLQDNGTIKIAPDGRADMAYGGDGFDVMVDPEDSDVAWGETPNGAMRRTADGGRTWTTVTPPGISRQRFNTPFELDPLDSEHIVYGGGQVAESVNGSTSWTTVFDLATDGVPTAAATTVNVRGTAAYVGWCGLAVGAPAGASPCNINTPAGGGYDGDLFVRGIATNVEDGCERDAAATDCWHQAAARGLPNRLIQGIAIDPDDPKTIYVALATYSRHWVVDRRLMGGGSVFRSTDAGETFTDVSGNIPDAIAADVLVVGDRLVLATDAGVFATAGRDSTQWVPMGRGLPPVPAYDLSLDPEGEVLVAATHGRGIWTLDLGAGPAPPTGRPTPTTRPRRIATTGLPGWPLLGVPVLALALLLGRRTRAR